MQPGADPHPQARDGKVDEGEGDAGKAVAQVDELVDEDDGNGGGQVEDHVECNHHTGSSHLVCVCVGVCRHVCVGVCRHVCV